MDDNDPVRAFVTDERAEDLIEYAFLVGLIALLAIGAVAMLGAPVPGWYSSIQVALAAVPL